MKIPIHLAWHSYSMLHFQSIENLWSFSFIFDDFQYLITGLGIRQGCYTNFGDQISRDFSRIESILARNNQRSSGYLQLNREFKRWSRGVFSQRAIVLLITTKRVHEFRICNFKRSKDTSNLRLGGSSENTYQVAL